MLSPSLMSMQTATGFEILTGVWEMHLGMHNVLCPSSYAQEETVPERLFGAYT